VGSPCRVTSSSHELASSAVVRVPLDSRHDELLCGEWP
jgi:hypothetical protein